MIRLALAEADVEYKNIFVPDHESLEECRKKGGHLTTNIPMLSIDGVHYTQSLAILRKIGREFAGGVLYPLGEHQMLYEIDMLIDAAFDLRSLCYDNDGIDDLRKMRAVSSDILTTHLPNFQRLLGDKSYMCGANFTLADISVYDALANWAERLLPGVLDRFPALRAYVDRVASRPRIAAWLASETAATIGKEDWLDELPVWQRIAKGLKQTRSKADPQAKKKTTKLAVKSQSKKAKPKPKVAKKSANSARRR